VSISRRHLLALPALAIAAPASLKIVVTGGHPGDPECGCAGTIARLTDLGDQVVVLYLNRGEGYCGTSPLSQCASIRTAEARKACDILKARPVFAGQIDGQAIVDSAHYESFGRLLNAENPDAVFTQWPIDQHRDHRAVSALTLDAWLKEKKRYALYYYEVAEDTMMFRPDEYVDISSVESRRHAACYAHVSQQPDKWYPQQAAIRRSRGAAAHVPQADAFARHPDSKRMALPFLVG